MTDLFQMFKGYSIKHHRKIKNICAPLEDYLNIPVFTYYYIEADGRFGYLSNNIEFNEYYFSEKLYLDNPYYTNPSFFYSGHILIPCSIDENTQNALKKRFSADNLFLTIEASPERMEGFIFAEENVGESEEGRYLSKLDLFTKFGRYFKREAGDLIGRMQADKFNLRSTRGPQLFDKHENVPLAYRDPKQAAFLKKVFGLSPQEQRCLEYFRQGKSAQATGALMNLSQRTVESYFENIKNKMGCNSKYDLLSL